MKYDVWPPFGTQYRPYEHSTGYLMIAPFDTATDEMQGWYAGCWVWKTEELDKAIAAANELNSANGLLPYEPKPGPR